MDVTQHPPENGGKYLCLHLSSAFAQSDVESGRLRLANADGSDSPSA